MRSRAVPRMRDAAAERGQRGAETERAGEAVDEDGLAGSCARFAQRRISGANIAETRCALEGDIVGKRHQIVLRGGDVLAHAAVGISVELALRVRAESEIAAKGKVGAVHCVVGAASRA